MHTTPQTTSVPPNKFSPFGGAISKSLLTPCRRVGLSRKRKTPNSILKLPVDISISSNTSISSPIRLESTPVIRETRQNATDFDSPMKEDGMSKKGHEINGTTPVNIKNRKNKRKSKMNFDSPMKDEAVKGECCEKVTRIASSDSKAKKSLSLEDTVINDSHSLKLQERKIVELSHTLNSERKSKLEKIILESPNTKSENNEIPNLENIPAAPVVEDDLSSCDSLVISRSKKAKVVYDSDEDFLPRKKNKPKLKRTKSETPMAKKTIPKPISKVNSENMVDTLKNCRIPLHKLSEDEIMKNNSNYSSDDEIAAKVKKKKLVIVSDDEDDFKVDEMTETSPHSDNDFVRTSKNPAVTKLETKITILKENVLSTKPSSLDILEDEDDAFTSTPDRDKNEKKELIEKITVLEKHVKEKRKTLENLKQASVYKSIHNVEELEQLTNKFREGCVKGLNGLLAQLQAHSPINMNTLLNNLHIPPGMIARLFVKDES